MKKPNLLKFGTALLIAGMFSACSKEQKVNTVDLETIAQQLKFVQVNDRIMESNHSPGRVEIIIVSWNKWGRLKKNCKGLGLCDATWFPKPAEMVANPNPADGGASILEIDHNTGKYYFDILFASKPPASITNSSLEFGVDADLLLDTQGTLGTNLVIRGGLYSYDSSLGVYGGYRFYLDSI